jgi:hypothetical protein
MFFMRGRTEKDSYYRHFIWASYQQMPEEWGGRVRATTTPIKKAVKEQGNRFISATDTIDSSIGEMEKSLENVNQDIITAVDIGNIDTIRNIKDIV